jgi:Cu(I)/Ag(I) efflux system membrane fusion protein
MNPQINKTVIATAVVSVAVGALAARFMFAPAPEQPPAPAAAPQDKTELVHQLVQTQEIAVQEVNEVVAINGKLSIDATRLQQISARVPGRVDRLALVEGQAVQAGQALAWVFSPEFISAQNEFLLAKRTVAALNTDATKDLMEDAKSTLESARHKLRVLGASAADIAKLEGKGGAVQEYLVVSSLIHGKVIKRSVDPGGYLNTGDSVGTVADLSTLWFMGNVFEVDLPKLSVGQPVDIQVNGAAQDKYQGKISFISPTVDPQTHAVMVRVDLPNARGELKPDMFAKAQVRVGVRSLPVVPRVAVVQDGAQSFVMVQSADGQFKRAPVSVMATESPDLLAITSGVSPGDRVVTEGGVLVDRSLVNAAKLHSMAEKAAVKP